MPIKIEGTVSDGASGRGFAEVPISNGETIVKTDSLGN